MHVTVPHGVAFVMPFRKKGFRLGGLFPLCTKPYKAHVWQVAMVSDAEDAMHTPTASDRVRACACLCHCARTSLTATHATLATPVTHLPIAYSHATCTEPIPTHSENWCVNTRKYTCILLWASTPLLPGCAVLAMMMLMSKTWRHHIGAHVHVLWHTWGRHMGAQSRACAPAHLRPIFQY